MLKNLLVSSLLCSLVASAAFAKDYKVEKIFLNGNSQLPDDSVIYYLGLNIGSEYSQEEINKMVHKAYETGFFKKISISHSEFKNILIVDVVEQPLISSIKFFGNRQSDKDLQKAIKLKAGLTFSETKMKRDVESLLKSYQNKGMFNAIINPKIIDNDGGGVDIVFEIKEGKKAVIEKINFIGNTGFSSDELKKQILTSEWKFYKILSGGYLYDPDRLKVDSELLNDYYQSNGYPFAKVIGTTAELDSTNEAFIVTFQIESGKEYNFGRVKLNDQLKITEKSEIISALREIKSDSKFNIVTIREVIAKINDVLARKGYAFAVVDYEIKENDNKIDVEIKINSSQKFFVNRINIKNNNRTKENVIRREMRISEQDGYDIGKIERSLQRIKNLGYFENVQFTPKQVGEKDRVDLDVVVDEKRTGTASFNVGYNTVTGPFIGLKYSELNLLGTGRNLTGAFQVGKLEKNINLSLDEPYFMGYDITSGINLFYDNKTYDSGKYTDIKEFKQKYHVVSRGIGLHASYDITEYLKHDINYGLKFEDIDNISNRTMMSNFLKPDTRSHSVSAVGYSLIYDRTDFSLNPTKGYVLSFGQSFAGLGGDSKYMQNMFMAAHYFPVHKDKVVLKVSGRGGFMNGIKKKVRMMDNFYSEENMIRGFEYNGIGPRDAKTLDPLGGKVFFAASAEVKFSLGLPQELGMYGVGFTDFATLYNIDVPNSVNLATNPYFNSKKIRASKGFGVIWDSPVGLMRFEYAIPFMKTSYDQVQKFNFSIGKSF